MSKGFPMYLGLLACLLLAGCRQGGVTAKVAWLSDYGAATSAAASSGKPVLIAFLRTDVSAWSGRLQTEVFETEQFAAWTADKVIPLRIDLSNPQAGGSDQAYQASVELAKKYHVVGFPTVVLVSAEGKELGSLRYVPGGAGAWLAAADEVLAGKQAPSLPWVHSWEQASKESKASGKPILMDFTGSDWCIFCIKLKHEVFETEAFRQWAADKVVLMEVDFPRSFDLDPFLISQNEALAGKYGIQGYPTVVFTNADGGKLGSLGYREGGPAVWLKAADEALTGKPASPPDVKKG